MLEQLAVNLSDKISKFKEAGIAEALSSIRMGLERETLRVNASGRLAQTAHPSKLGSPMCNASITTDFAENLLEFVTAAHPNVKESLQELEDIQAFAMANLGDEAFWHASIPPMIEHENEISIAQYGNSNQARMKTLYREGLSLRYGRIMQSIAGIHYNFSVQDDFFKGLKEALASTQTLQDLRSEQYLNLTRNVQRFGFLVPYLFGASPTVHKSFLEAYPNHNLQALNGEDFYLPYATSLRLSDLGYNNAKCSFFVSSNNLNNYIKDLDSAISTVCNKFSIFGVKKDGKYLQINDHILQIENEYYTSIRPKPLPQDGMRPLLALANNGIAYMELRSLDVSPFHAIGLDLATAQFLQIFLTFCLIADAPLLTKQENHVCLQNLKDVAGKGRDPQLQITLFEQNYGLSHALNTLFDAMQPVAELLGQDYLNVFNEIRKRIDNPDLTPSAQILAMLKNQNITMQSFILNQSLAYKQAYQAQPLSEVKTKIHTANAQASLEQQAKIEASPQIPFEEYLQNYFQKV